MNAIPTTTLHNGVVMPLLGLGVFQMTDADECTRVVTEALQMGYRLIDTAAGYGNEEAVGRAIRQSGVPRAEIFVTTKLWISDAGAGRTQAAFERSLQRLQLDYLDLYLIHQPYGDVYGAWRDMEALYQAGRIRAIGVSNFATDRVMDFLMHQQVAPMVNQIETHPFCQQIEAQRFLQEHRVQMQSWGPFAEGRNNLFQHEVLQDIARSHAKSVAQVVLRWLLQRGVVAIPKTVKRERLAENMAVLDFALTDAEMQTIVALDTQTSSFFDHRDPAVVMRLSQLVRAT